MVDYGMETEVLSDTGKSPTLSLDVRIIPPRLRHPLIFRTFAMLCPEESFEIVNDHDPRPLEHHFQMEFGASVGWNYLEQGPDLWRVRISRLV